MPDGAKMVTLNSPFVWTRSHCFSALRVGSRLLPKPPVCCDFDPSADVVLNPLDARSPYWSPTTEVNYQTWCVRFHQLAAEHPHLEQRQKFPCR